MPEIPEDSLKTLERLIKQPEGGAVPYWRTPQGAVVTKVLMRDTALQITDTVDVSEEPGQPPGSRYIPSIRNAGGSLDQGLSRFQVIG